MPESPRFLPGRHAIDAYGDGGFRFGAMSHRGSILILPSGIRAWSATAARDLDTADFALVFAEAGDIDVLLVGTGQTLMPISGPLHGSLREAGISADAMPTGTAARTYNVLMAENRRLAAALIAVD